MLRKNWITWLIFLEESKYLLNTFILIIKFFYALYLKLIQPEFHLRIA